HELQRLGRPGERERLRDVGLHLALLVPGRDLPQAVDELLRFALAEIAPEHADDRRALEEREVERQLWNLSRGEADDQQPAAPGDGAERKLGVRPADRVVDDVGPPSL